jgi:hypothetical protein
MTAMQPRTYANLHLIYQLISKYSEKLGASTVAIKNPSALGTSETEKYTDYFEKFYLTTDTPEIIILGQMRKILLRPAVPSSLTSSTHTDYMTLNLVIWISLSPSSYDSGFRK